MSDSERILLYAAPVLAACFLMQSIADISGYALFYLVAYTAALVHLAAP